MFDFLSKPTTFHSRSRRYTLNKVMVDGKLPPKVKKDAHDIILDFIRSRPPLKPVSPVSHLPVNPATNSIWSFLVGRRLNHWAHRQTNDSSVARKLHHFGPACQPPEWRHFLFTSGITNLSLQTLTKPSLHSPLNLVVLISTLSHYSHFQQVVVILNLPFLHHPVPFINSEWP